MITSLAITGTATGREAMGSRTMMARTTQSVLRLRWQGSADEWAIGIFIGAGRATPVASAQEIREWVAEQEYPAYGTAIEAGAIGDWTFVLEPGGYQAVYFAEQLSEDGEAVVIYRSINADSS